MLNFLNNNKEKNIALHLQFHLQFPMKKMNYNVHMLYIV